MRARLALIAALALFLLAPPPAFATDLTGLPEPYSTPLPAFAGSTAGFPRVFAEGTIAVWRAENSTVIGRGGTLFELWGLSPVECSLCAFDGAQALVIEAMPADQFRYNPTGSARQLVAVTVGAGGLRAWRLVELPAQPEISAIPRLEYQVRDLDGDGAFDAVAVGVLTGAGSDRPWVGGLLFHFREGAFRAGAAFYMGEAPRKAAVPLNLRAAPRAEASVLATIPPGTELSMGSFLPFRGDLVGGVFGFWVRVEYSPSGGARMSGYVFSAYLAGEPRS